MDRLNDVILLLGRLLMTALFLPVGVHKLTNPDMLLTQSLVRSGLPFPGVLTVIGIAVEIAGPLAILLGVFPRLSALLLIAFTLVATFVSHHFWTFPAAQWDLQFIQFLKNVGLMGGLMFYLVSGPGRFSLPFGRRW